LLLSDGVKIDAASSSTASQFLFLCQRGARSEGCDALFVPAQLTLDSLRVRPGVGRLCLPPFFLSEREGLINIQGDNQVLISTTIIFLAYCILNQNNPVSKQRINEN